MKELQDPVVKTAKNLGPILAEIPDVLEKLMPTLKEIIAAVKDNADVPDETFIKWGKSLLKIGGPHLRKKFQAIEDSPISEILTKINGFKLDDKIGKLLEGGMKEKFNEIVK